MIRLYERAGAGRSKIRRRRPDPRRVRPDRTAVAEKELYERMDFSNPVPGRHVYDTLAATVPLLKAIPNNLPRWATPRRPWRAAW